MTASDYPDVIQKVYIAYFGRAADPGGLEFYANLLAAGNAPATSEGFVAASGTNAAVKDMLAGFAASAESKAFYSSPDLSEHVKQIYLNVLGRTAEQGGVDYWVAQVASGNLSLSRAAFVILQAAEIGLKARHAFCRAVALLLETPPVGTTRADDWIMRATDRVDEAMHFLA